MNLKIPKIPRIAKTWNTSGPHMSGGKDTIGMMKRFFMYRNMFGNGFGNLPGAPMNQRSNDNIGDVQTMAAARRMGIM